jgi:hypothetical protein
MLKRYLEITQKNDTKQLETENLTMSAHERGVKRKRIEKIKYDEIIMIDYNTKSEERKKKRRHISVKKVEAHDLTGLGVNSPDFCPSTPPLTWNEREKSQIDEMGGGGKEERQRQEEGKESNCSLDKEDPRVHDEELINTVAEFPFVPKQWWITYVIIKKYEERLSWAWRNCSKSFNGTFLIPQELFCFLWKGIGQQRDTGKKIIITISTLEEMKKLDTIFENRKEWRKKKFYHQDSEESQYIGQCRIVLQVQKKVSWTVNTFVTCSSDFKLEFDKKNSVLHFKGTVEGRNQIKALRF